MLPASILAFDVGNTRIKAAWFLDGKLQDAIAVAHDDDSLRLLCREMDRHPPPAAAVISTVNQAASDRLLPLLGQRSIPVRQLLKSDGSLFDAGLLTCGVQTPKTTGVDRLLSSLAATKRSPGRAVFVIDCGSAVTVNLTTADRVFQGGAILPGRRLMTSALQKGTAALPSAPLDGVPSALGRSTIAAIQSGVYFSVVGGIDRLIEEMTRQALPSEGATEPAIFLTGGDAELFGPGLKTTVTTVPYLVLEGLMEAVMRGT